MSCVTTIRHASACAPQAGDWRGKTRSKSCMARDARAVARRPACYGSSCECVVGARRRPACAAAGTQGVRELREGVRLAVSDSEGDGERRGVTLTDSTVHRPSRVLEVEHEEEDRAPTRGQSSSTQQSSDVRGERRAMLLLKTCAKIHYSLNH